MEVTEEEEEKSRVPQVSVPSQREIEDMLIRRKKKVSVIDVVMVVNLMAPQELLERYTSDSLQEEVERVMALLIRVLTSREWNLVHISHRDQAQQERYGQ